MRAPRAVVRSEGSVPELVVTEALDGDADRARAVLAALRSAGWNVTRSVVKPPFGWRCDAAGQMVEDEREQAMIRYILRRRRSGMSLAALATALNAEGWFRQNGGRWRSESVRRVIGRHERSQGLSGDSGGQSGDTTLPA